MKNALIICEGRRIGSFYDEIRSMGLYGGIEQARYFSQGCHALTKRREPEDHLSLVVIQPELELSAEEIARGLTLITNHKYSIFLREKALFNKCAGVSLVGLVGVGARIIVDASGLSQTEVPVIKSCLEESGHIYGLIEPGELNSLQERVETATPGFKTMARVPVRTSH